VTLLENNELTKRFGATLALDGVSFKVEASRFHSLVGENGAGKSTLIKSLMGVFAPDHGAFALDGRPYVARDPLDATRQGIAAIYQEPAVAPELSVAENILMGNLPTQSGMVRGGKVISAAQDMIDKLGVDLRADLPASEISASQRVLLGLVRALSSNPRLLICDEPTAHFSPEQADHLFALLKNFLNEGNAILYVSHRLEEVLEQSDDITVLRDGKHVETLSAEGLTERELIRRMVGRYQENLYPVLNAPGAKPRLEVRDFTHTGSNAAVNLSVAEGEVLGLYGLVGAGRSDLLRGVFGDLTRTSGEILLDGAKTPGERPDKSVKAGLAIITEDRRKDGLSEDRPIVDNTSLPALPWLSRLGFVRRRLEHRNAQASLEKYGVKYADMNDPVRSLSGGNQQKVVLAKWGMNHPRVYLLDEPTVGVDIGAKEAIYNHIRDLAADGAAVVLVSSYLPEVMGMSHRILVVRNGAVVGEAIPENTSEQELVEMASGVSENEH
jgi:ABC-type sugar transport system ATPase subunit